MICEPCGKKLEELPSAACRECYLVVLEKNKRLRKENKRMRETILYFRKQFQRFTNKGIAYCQYDIDRCNDVLGLTDEEIKELDNMNGGCPVSGG